jgi:ribosomal protein L40E
MESVEVGWREIMVTILSFVFLLWLHNLVSLLARNFLTLLRRQKGYQFLATYIRRWQESVLKALFVIDGTNKINGATPAQQRLGERKSCFVCGALNTPTAPSCTKCGITFPFINSSGRAVETMILTDDVREEVNEGRIRVCQRCGRLNSPKRRVCKSCGAEFAV